MTECLVSENEGEGGEQRPSPCRKSYGCSGREMDRCSERLRFSDCVCFWVWGGRVRSTGMGKVARLSCLRDGLLANGGGASRITMPL